MLNNLHKSCYAGKLNKIENIMKHFLLTSNQKTSESGPRRASAAGKGRGLGPMKFCLQHHGAVRPRATRK